MRRHVPLILICGMCVFYTVTAVSQDTETTTITKSAIRVTTALNHLTVLEFQEPVRLVAAGGADFQIERQENKVFVKPLKSGVATNLFVWTASRRFNYELEPAGEVKDMNFAIDNSVTAAKPAVDPQVQLDQLADMMLTRAFLGAEPIDNTRISAAKNCIGVRIEQVFRTKNSLYVHYSIENHSKTPYHVTPPSAFQLQVNSSSISLPALEHRQLDQQRVKELGDLKVFALPIGHAEAKPEDLSPGESANGVVAIRWDLSSPVVLQLVFDENIKAILVL
jgi:hypothetical protein